MFRSGHVDEDQLLEHYMAARVGDTVDPRVTDHITSCRACRGHFDSLAAFLDDDREAAVAEADALFPAEYRHAQRQQMLQQLEHVHRSARVITFPGREVAAPVQPALARLTPRWLAAAAAAGLFIGVAVGGYIGPDRFGAQRTTRTTGSAAMSVQPAPAAVPSVLVSNSQPAPVLDDDEFLMQLELALAGPQPRELQAFDALTPHVRDIR